MNYHLRIEEVKIGCTSGNINDNQESKNFITACKLVDKKNDNVFWIYDVNVNDTPNFFVAKEDIYKELYYNKYNTDDLSKYKIDECDGVIINNYPDIQAQLLNTTRKQALIIKLIIYLDYAENEGIKSSIKKIEGKYLDEIDFL